jgi:hypothetical protein
MAAVALAASAAMAVHVAAGHAAAGGRLSATAVGAQWVHFAAVGLWTGGLAALLLGVRGAPSESKASAVRRFSGIAAIALLVVVVTGVARTLDELTAWRELLSSGYGRAVLAKVCLLLALAAFGAFNRWRSVPLASHNLRPLRQAGSGELALAASALLAAAVLGTLPPPASGFAPAVELDVSGTDYATTMRARLTAPSDEPGPNRFVIHLLDYDTKTPVGARRVSLRFTPVDDPGVATTSLALEAGPGDSYVGSGANLAFDGRWRVTVVVERPSDSVEIPLEIRARSAPQFVSVERIPGKAPGYLIQAAGGEQVRISPDPERAGPSKVQVAFWDLFGDDREIEGIVVTTAAREGSTRQQPVQRLGRNRFVADVVLRPGRNTIAAIARTTDGTRVRAEVGIDVPAE